MNALPGPVEASTIVYRVVPERFAPLVPHLLGPPATGTPSVLAGHPRPATTGMRGRTVFVFSLTRVLQVSSWPSVEEVLFLQLCSHLYTLHQ